MEHYAGIDDSLDSRVLHCGCEGEDRERGEKMPDAEPGMSSGVTLNFTAARRGAKGSER
jgi:hypothetical protein